ncbi:MAG: hypothetical protein WBA74_05120, partial [Cyclobacteriaceae bacterium]
IRLEATIDLSEQTEDIDGAVADILYRVKRFLSEEVRFRTLSEMLEKGRSIEEIFEGPVLDHGFIDNDDLLSHERKTEIHASDLIREIMDVPDVLSVSDLTMISGSNNAKNWVFPLDSNKTPTLDVLATLEKLTIRTGTIPAYVRKNVIARELNQQVLAHVNKKTLTDDEKDLAAVTGKNRKVENYYSFQNHFPATYSIGQNDLPESVPDKRKALSKQLKAYLALFDQLLANYLSQTARFKDLINYDSDQQKAFFKQSLVGKVAGMQEILKNESEYEEYVSGQSEDLSEVQQRDRFLNHLLARFGEHFSAYNVMLQNEETEPFDRYRKMISDKAAFLRNLPELSGERGKGFDLEVIKKTERPLSGLERRIAAKIGLKTDERATFYLVEHIFLRPTQTNTIELEEYYLPGQINSFGASKHSKRTVCSADGHHLKKGEMIRISSSEIYSGSYEIASVSDSSFEIEKIYEESTESTGSVWRRSEPDLRFMLFSESVEAFSEGSVPGKTYCLINNRLSENDQVMIAGSADYDGNYTISNVSAEGFEIDISFISKNEGALCLYQLSSFDPYSLQVTYVFPADEAIYRDSIFRDFIEKTVREETPVHVRPYIKWWSRAEMKSFVSKYEKHLKELANPVLS